MINSPLTTNRQPHWGKMAVTVLAIAAFLAVLMWARQAIYAEAARVEAQNEQLREKAAEAQKRQDELKRQLQDLQQA